MATSTTTVPKFRPIRDGLLLNAGEALERVRLAGTYCVTCHETSLGVVQFCPNCGSDRVQALPLSNRGTVWTYTVARHKPPGDYRGPEPFVPFGIALVELPEGLRVVSRVDCDVAQIRVGMPVDFTPYLRHDADGGTVLTFTYKPAA